MIKNKNWSLLVTICALFVGILLMFQLKAQAKVDIKAEIQSDNVVLALAPYTLGNEQIQAENDKLSTEIEQYRRGVDAALVADTRLKRAQLLAGLVAVKGPGIRVVLDDSVRDVVNHAEVNNYIIHEEYLRGIVNALWNSQAEAIAINGERLTSLSEIFCQGTVININGKPQIPPYAIEAIGDSQTLLKGIQFTVKYQLGLTYNAEAYGIKYHQEEVKQLQLPAGRNAVFRLAMPVKEGS